MKTNIQKKLLKSYLQQRSDMPVATVNLAASKNQVDIPEGISRTVNSLYKTSTS